MRVDPNEDDNWGVNISTAQDASDIVMYVRNLQDARVESI